jgi:hypothetical protein
MKSFCVKANQRGDGRSVYDDGVARAAELDDGRFLLECSGFSVECDILQIAEAASALIGMAGGKLSVLEASRAVLFDLEEGLDA